MSLDLAAVLGELKIGTKFYLQMLDWFSKGYCLLVGIYYARVLVVDSELD
jgi:hypothetical protein